MVFDAVVDTIIEIRGLTYISTNSVGSSYFSKRTFGPSFF